MRIGKLIIALAVGGLLLSAATVKAVQVSFVTAGEFSADPSVLSYWDASGHHLVSLTFIPNLLGSLDVPTDGTLAGPVKFGTFTLTEKFDVMGVDQSQFTLTVDQSAPPVDPNEGVSVAILSSTVTAGPGQSGYGEIRFDFDPTDILLGPSGDPLTDYTYSIAGNTSDSTSRSFVIRGNGNGWSPATYDLMGYISINTHASPIVPLPAAAWMGVAMLSILGGARALRRKD